MGPTRNRRAALRARLDPEWRALRGRWAEKRREEGGTLAGESAQLDAALFRQALRGARSSEGGWAWLRHPPPGQRHNGGRALWLTQRPDSSYEKAGRELLLGASNLPVDQVHAQLRRRIRAFKRPSDRAAPGPSYEEASKDPRAVLAELWIGLLLVNFGPRRLADGGPPKAAAMGLARKGGGLTNLGRLAWGFRLDLDHAERISEWLRQ